MTDRIRILIVDDHPIVRLGLQGVFKLQEDMDLVGLAEDGDQGLALAESTAADVILLDLRMPELSGIEVLKRLSRAVPAARVIVLSSFELDEEIYQATQAGAVGFLNKEAAAEDILTAVRKVFAGQTAFPRHITERLNAGRRLTAGLSSRELEVLELVGKGLTNKEAAKTLNISQFTVRNHLNHIAAKLDVSDRTEAIFVAVQTGLIRLT